MFEIEKHINYEKILADIDSVKTKIDIYWVKLKAKIFNLNKKANQEKI